MLPISVCIIAKNEEQYIGECLSRLIKFDWEIVVVDTGSIDRTVDIARTYTPNVFHFNWINDFSAARNYSISKAHNSYILVIDCDEYLEVPSLTAETVLTLPNLVSPKQVGLIELHNLSTALTDDLPEGNPDIICDRVARFFHKDYTYYQGSIHEQLVSRDGNALSFVSLPIRFQHVGYNTIEARAVKAARNIAMLQRALDVNSSDPYLYFQMGQSHFGIADYKKALPYFEKALSLDVDEREDFVQTLVESYGYSLLYLERYETALQLEGVYDIFSKRADFVFLMGLIYMNSIMFEKAIDAFLHAASIPNHAVEGVNSYKAFYNVGVIYECMSHIPEALKYYEKCGNYAPALHRISSLTQ
ncbi:glycosyltransferase [Kineothrix sedimenti]|uniref:Glycosyltransferase n=1 Tax=Kineothrix sedimenti TaxID=3123317 RepID=A0ABZ3EXG2_9FIRM